MLRTRKILILPCITVQMPLVGFRPTRIRKTPRSKKTEWNSYWSLHFGEFNLTKLKYLHHTTRETHHCGIKNWKDPWNPRCLKKGSSELRLRKGIWKMVQPAIMRRLTVRKVLQISRTTRTEHQKNSNHCWQEPIKEMTKNKRKKTKQRTKRKRWNVGRNENQRNCVNYWWDCGRYRRSHLKWLYPNVS